MTEKTSEAMKGSVKVRLLRFWSNPDHGPSGEREKATPKSIDQFESRHGIRLPADFREFFEEVGGFDQDRHYQDAQGFNFWPLTKLSRVSECDGHGLRFTGDHRYFLFCDYLDFSWAYAIRLGVGKNDVILVGTNDGKPKLVARSFTDFVTEYLKDGAVLYP